MRRGDAVKIARLGLRHGPLARPFQIAAIILIGIAAPYQSSAASYRQIYSRRLQSSVHDGVDAFGSEQKYFSHSYIGISGLIGMLVGFLVISTIALVLNAKLWKLRPSKAGPQDAEDTVNSRNSDQPQKDEKSKRPSGKAVSALIKSPFSKVKQWKGSKQEVQPNTYDDVKTILTKTAASQDTAVHDAASQDGLGVGTKSNPRFLPNDFLEDSSQHGGPQGKQLKSVQIALERLSSNGLLYAGKYRFEEGSCRMLGSSAVAICRDVTRGSKHLLHAFFHFSEDDYQREMRARTALSSKNMPIPEVVASFGEGIALNGDDLPACIILKAGDTNLADWIYAHGNSRDGPEIPQFLKALAVALENLQSHGYVHGDLRPNMVWHTFQQGFARLGNVSSIGLAGTPLPELLSIRHAAPEAVATGSTKTRQPSNDIWSFGCIAYELYAGFPLFGIRYTNAQVRDSLRSPNLLPWALSDDFFRSSISNPSACQMIEKALKWNPEERCSLQQILEHDLLGIASMHTKSQLSSIESDPGNSSNGVVSPFASLINTASLPNSTRAPAVLERSESNAANSDFGRSRRLLRIRTASCEMGRRSRKSNSCESLPSIYSSNPRDMGLDRRSYVVGGYQEQPVRAANLPPDPQGPLRRLSARQSHEQLPTIMSGYSESNAEHKSQGILTGNPLPVPEAASNQPGCLHAANSLVQADSNRNCNLDAPVQSVMPSDFTMPVQDSLGQEPLSFPEAASKTPESPHTVVSLPGEDRNRNLDAPVRSVAPSVFAMPEHVTTESDLMRKNTRPKGNSPQRAASKHIRPNRRPNTKSRDSNRQSRQHSRRLSSHQTSTSSPKDSLANEEDPEEPSVLALQSSRCEAVSAGDNFLDDMQSQGQAHALELISSEGIGSPTLALMSEALPASKLGQEALQEGLPVSLLTGDLNIAQLPLLSQSSEVPTLTLAPPSGLFGKDTSPASSSTPLTSEHSSDREAAFKHLSEKGASPKPITLDGETLKHASRDEAGEKDPEQQADSSEDPLATETKEELISATSTILTSLPTFTLRSIPVGALSKQTGRVLLVDVQVHKVLPPNCFARVLSYVTDPGISSQRVPAVSCQDLENQPVFLLAPGDQYIFHIRLVMRDIVGRVPLAVRGVSTISFGSDDLESGAAMQVVTTNERIAEGHWEGYACWNANFLQSKLEQRVHLRMELSFPLQGDIISGVALQHDLYLEMTQTAWKSDRPSLKRSKSYLEALQAQPWGEEFSYGSLSFAHLTRC